MLTGSKQQAKCLQAGFSCNGLEGIQLAQHADLISTTNHLRIPQQPNRNAGGPGRATETGMGTGNAGDDAGNPFEGLLDAVLGIAVVPVFVNGRPIVFAAVPTPA